MGLGVNPNGSDLIIVTVVLQYGVFPRECITDGRLVMHGGPTY